MARPSKLTPDQQKRITDALAVGNTRMDSAEHGGIGYSTFRRWVAAGKRRPKSTFGEFWRAVKRAESQAAVGFVTVIRKATIGGSVIERRTITHKDGRVEVVEKVSEPQWTAGAWWLERRRPEFSRDAGELNRLRKTVADLEKLVNEHFKPSN